MTAESGKELKAGDRVRWTDGSLGTVRETGYAAIKVEWDDNKWAIMQFSDERTPWASMERVSA